MPRLGLLLAIGFILASVAGSIMAQDDKSASNVMGPVTNNSGIVTQGQVGNNTINNAPPRREDGIYQSGQLVGMVAGFKTGPGSDQITFTNMRISGMIDQSKPFEFQSLVFKYPFPVKAGVIGTFGLAVSGDTICEVLGKRE